MGSNMMKKGMLGLGAVLLCIVLVFAGIIVKNKMELYYVEEQTLHFLEEIKVGYIEENDCDVPLEVYHYLTKDWNPVVKSVVEYGVGGEEEWKRGWSCVLEKMEYSVDSVQKVEDQYHIAITVRNKDIVAALVETSGKLWESKEKLLAGLLTGTTAEQFWDSYEESRDETDAIVKGTYTIKMYKNDKRNWEIEYDSNLLGTMAGIGEEYSVILPDGKKVLEISAKKDK